MDVRHHSVISRDDENAKSVDYSEQGGGQTVISWMPVEKVSAHTALGCRDLSRADFVVPDGSSEVLLEVNTLPGMTPTSLYPDAAAHFGYDFAALVSLLVERAANRKSS